MTQIKGGMARFRRDQEIVRFRKPLEFDKIIKQYKSSRVQFIVKNVSSNAVIGEFSLKISDYVGVRDQELTLVDGPRGRESQVKKPIPQSQSNDGQSSSGASVSALEDTKDQG